MLLNRSHGSNYQRRCFGCKNVSSAGNSCQFCVRGNLNESWLLLLLDRRKRRGWSGGGSSSTITRRNRMKNNEIHFFSSINWRASFLDFRNFGCQSNPLTFQRTGPEGLGVWSRTWWSGRFRLGFCSSSDNWSRRSDVCRSSNRCHGGCCHIRATASWKWRWRTQLSFQLLAIRTVFYDGLANLVRSLQINRTRRCFRRLSLLSVICQPVRTRWSHNWKRRSSRSRRAACWVLLGATG